MIDLIWTSSLWGVVVGFCSNRPGTGNADTSAQKAKTAPLAARLIGLDDFREAIDRQPIPHQAILLLDEDLALIVATSLHEPQR